MSPRILNLGCGNRVMADALNHDSFAHRPEIGAVHDLNVTPWPWKDCSFDQVVAFSVLEHLNIDLVGSLDECWRILRPGGQLSLKLPHWNSDSAHDDPTHRFYFSLHSLDQFDPETKRGREYPFYTPRKWRIVRAPELNSGGSSIHATLEVRKP